MTTPKRLAPGDVIPPRRLATIRGAEVSIPDPARLVHFQFRRFAGCPACNLHLRAFDRRLDQLTAAGIHEVVVFHSNTEALRSDLTETRFDVIADPSKELYVAHGVESSLWSVLDPRAWGALAGGMLRGLATPPASGEGALGLPAFDLTGAAASRTFAGDPAVAVVIPLAIAALALVSWALRPANRRM